MSRSGPGRLPLRADLKRRESSLSGTSWHLFDHPWRGTPSYAGSAEAVDAARLVEWGEIFGLDYPIDAFTPGLSKARQPVRHAIYANHSAHRDDYLDSFYLQSSTQVDGLRHRRADGLGFYAGVPDDRVIPGTDELGVQVWAEDPIVTRGVVLDLTDEADVDHAAGEPVEFSRVENALRRQEVPIRNGDIVMLHTGWSEWFLALPDEDKRRQRSSGHASGLVQNERLLDWAWDNGIALLAADNFAVECLPPVADSPFATSAPSDGGMMHQEFLAKLGMPLGELWRIGPLARRMRELGRWESLVVVKPLNVVGGTGSPANATAVL